MHLQYRHTVVCPSVLSFHSQFTWTLAFKSMHGLLARLYEVKGVYAILPVHVRVRLRSPVHAHVRDQNVQFLRLGQFLSYYNTWHTFRCEED